MATGTVGTCLISLAAMGAGGVLVHDPVISDTSFTWIRFGHGRDLASALLYIGIALLVLAWVRLGRDVRNRLVGMRGVMTAITAWSAPLLVAPPLFSRDIYSYLAQGALALHGMDPYKVGPSAMPGPLADNVSAVWQNTPAPYGPLFVIVAKATVWLTGDSLIFGVLVLRLVMFGGLAMLCWSMPGLARHLGGRGATALWITAANPLILVHLVGGPHNDILMIGFLAAGMLLALDHRFVPAIVLITLGAAVKATAALALPFVVWMWAATMIGGSLRQRFALSAVLGGLISIGTFTVTSIAAGVDLGWISALKVSSIVVNWLSVPTAMGQILHSVVGVFHDYREEPFVSAGRSIGYLVLGAVMIWQWWLARVGGVESVKRAGMVLLAVAALSPTTFPWYFTWSLVLAAGFAWSTTALLCSTFMTVLLMLVTYPTGNSALYDWGFMATAAIAAMLAAFSVLQEDPLGLRRPRNSPASPELGGALPLNVRG
ncbi:hypothetical protein D5S17_12805 [Pseudonocardiaceae bacterium YIM PH 21723]|nr:hypothetical protein D5S17_12805 [Pseudonocardiaceae bacterium YIM PH 21723]